MRLRSIATLATLAAAGAVMPAGTATAAGEQCSIVVPTKIVMDSPYEGVPLRLASNCASAGAYYAAWEFVHPTQGVDDVAVFDGTTTDTWDMYDWSTTPGGYTVRPSGSFSSDFMDEFTQNTATTTVKLGSRLTATTARANGVMTFSALAKTYSPKLSTWYQRAGATVSLVYLAPGSSTWTWVKNATTSSTGRATVSVAPKYGQYRLQIKETSTVWAAYSSIVRGK